MKPTKIRLLLADDHTVLRAGLRLLLDSQEDMIVIGEAISGEEAIEKARALKPDVVLLDISMPGMGGLNAISRISNEEITKVLMLTMHQDKEYLQQALSEGAKGYVLKQAADTELLDAIRRVARGEVYVDKQLAQELFKNMYRSDNSGRTAASSLSEREKEVLKLVALGYTNKEIGESLSVSIKTVETHKAKIMEKTGCQRRSELVRYAIQNGFITK